MLAMHTPITITSLFPTSLLFWTYSHEAVGTLPTPPDTLHPLGAEDDQGRQYIKA